MARHSTHECCKERTTLRSNDCCCKAPNQLGSQTINTVPQDKHAAVTFAAAFSHAALSQANPTQRVGAPTLLRQGPAPPDTPLTRHTQLLL